MSGLDKAITAVGGKRRLALALNIKPSSLSRWIHKYQGQVPPKRVIQVYEATGITPHELRPDLHPNPTSGLPEKDTANSNVARLERLGGNDGAEGREGTTGPAAAPGVHLRPLEVNGFWRDADWLFCRDGKWRPVEPGTFPLVDGAAARMGRVEPGVARVASSNRVGRLKGYGNAINAQAAAAFIRAYMEVV